MWVVGKGEFFFFGATVGRELGVVRGRKEFICDLGNSLFWNAVIGTRIKLPAIIFLLHTRNSYMHIIYKVLSSFMRA